MAKFAESKCSLNDNFSLPEIAKSMQARSFFSRLEFDIALSPSSWNVIMIKATKIFTKKNGNTMKNTFTISINGQRCKIDYPVVEIVPI